MAGERTETVANHPKSMFLSAAVLAIVVAITVGCGTNSGDKDSSQAVASLQAPSSPSGSSINSSDEPSFPNVVVHEEDIETPKVVPTDLGLVWEAWEHLNRDYVDRDKLDPELAAEYAIRGITSILGDPQTAYVGPDVLKGQFGDVFEGEFQGIGAHVQMNARGNLVIVSPIEGGPAAAAGIKPGDIILEVDGESLEGLGVLEAVAKIRGPKDSIARLLVKHLGALDPEIVEVRRAVIPLESVYLRSEPGDDFIHVRVTDFYPQTSDKLRAVVEQELNAGAKGLILDLRNNGGGLLTASVDIASQFIEDGLALYVIEGNKRRTDYHIKSENRDFLTDVPMVVLVNGGSASASEILAGSLQDHGRATVIGDTTFGKGSVNWLRNLSNGGGLYITIAYWYTPDGRLIQGEGLDPDIMVTDRDAQEADVAQFKRAIEELQRLTGATGSDSNSDASS